MHRNAACACLAILGVLFGGCSATADDSPRRTSSTGGSAGTNAGGSGGSAGVATGGQAGDTGGSGQSGGAGGGGAGAGGASVGGAGAAGSGGATNTGGSFATGGGGVGGDMGGSGGTGGSGGAGGSSGTGGAGGSGAAGGTTDPGTGGSAGIPATLTAKNGQTLHLAWQEEFDGPNIDTSIWNRIDKDPKKNNEVQYYRPDNGWIENGTLVLEARKESYGGKSYTSEEINTQNKKTFGYGRFIARLKAPAEDGMWPAFWLIGLGNWPDSGEIDIFEGKGRTPAWVSSAIHWGPSSGGTHPMYTQNFTFPAGTPDTSDWHEYNLEWNASMMQFWVDNRAAHLTMQTSQIACFGAGKQMYLILNLALGGTWDVAPPPDMSPQRMVVDWVRYYQL